MEFITINNSDNLLKELQAAIKRQLDNKAIKEADIQKFINLVNNTTKLKTVIKYL